MYKVEFSLPVSFNPVRQISPLLRAKKAILMFINIKTIKKFSKLFILHPVTSASFILLLFVLVACSSQEAGASIPPRTENISIAGVAERPAIINLDAPSGEVTVKGIAANPSLVSGTIEYNSEALKPTTEETDKGVSLSQKLKDQKLPNPLINKWNLQIGKPNPLELNFTLGNGNLNFTAGDLKLTKLIAKINNGDLNVNFDKLIDSPNNLDLNVTNGKIILKGILKSAPDIFTLKSGKGEINLDLAGDELRRSLAGSIGIGEGKVILTLPAGVGARIECTITTGSCSPPGFKRVGNTNYFENEAFAKGGKTITLRIGISNGSLEVTIK
jgi:N-terminal domain of toast_rack, DUF2154